MSPQRVIFDLGLVRSIGYYTGAVFEVYDPALGAPIGGGGRYDDLLGRFGRSLPAVGFALGRRPAAHGARRRGARHRACCSRSLPGSSSHELPERSDDRGAARGAVQGHGRPAGRARDGHRGAARERPQAAVRGDRRDHDAPLGRAHVRRGGRRRRGDHGQGRAAGAGQARIRRSRPPRERPRGVRAARPRLWPLHDGAGEPARAPTRRSRRCGGWG